LSDDLDSRAFTRIQIETASAKVMIKICILKKTVYNWPKNNNHKGFQNFEMAIVVRNSNQYSSTVFKCRKVRE
jgi:hypothetical protein